MKKFLKYIVFTDSQSVVMEQGKLIQQKKKKKTKKTQKLKSKK